MMSSRALAASALALVACGGGPKRGATASGYDGPRGTAIELVPTVAAQQWYRSTAICGQGPYELEVPVGDSRWGEEFELRLAAPRRIALQAVIVADGEEVAKRSATFDHRGRVDGKPDNTRCIADLKERLAAHGTGPRVPGTTTEVETGITVKPPPAPTTPAPAVTGQLQLDGGLVPESIEVVRFAWREGGKRASRIRIRFWSIEPNDLEGVLFGVVRVAWQPNVPEAEYVAYLARIAAAEEAARRRREDEWRRQQEAEARRRPAAPPRPAVTIQLDAKQELERYKQREEERRRRALELVREQERKRRRVQFCAAHPEDRGCWGAGGLRVYQDLAQHEAARARYCDGHPEDARCWSAAERNRREVIWYKRVQVALAPPKDPDGPPPAALAETMPPRLSVNAEWRPGYWQWTGSSWVWLAGMWRVPEADIVAEQTTVAPDAPPPPRSEEIPPPPMVTTVWVNGFWQWSGTTWVWVPGSYQARPEVGVSWRPTQWRARGRVHILIPGAWVRGGGR